MTDFTVELTKVGYLGWFWRVTKDGYEVFDYSFNKWLAKKAVAETIRKWERETVTETYTVKAKSALIKGEQ